MMDPFLSHSHFFPTSPEEITWNTFLLAPSHLSLKGEGGGGTQVLNAKRLKPNKGLELVRCDYFFHSML